MKKTTPLLFIILILSTSNIWAWSNHTLISGPLLQSMPVLQNAPPATVETIEDFLIATETELAVFLETQEQTMRQQLWYYAPRPDALKFEASGDINTIRSRFTRAIRVNPNMKLPLYLQLLPGDERDAPSIAASDITIFKEDKMLESLPRVQLQSGDKVSPIDVVISGNDEPDHGLDIGLFTDSNTDYGLEFGFGPQPFGNPNLEYSSQAPFHMGFYHESSVIYTFGAFLSKTYPEYRIRLFKELSEFAFQHGHDYWGWRFMGWGMHYIGDFSNPYHITPVPGNSTLSTVWVGLLNILGFPQAQLDATQLVSNRHTVIEDFQSLVMTKAFAEHHKDHQLLQALKQPESVRQYKNSDVVGVFSKKTYDKSTVIDTVLTQAFPTNYINDTTIEYADLKAKNTLVETVTATSGPVGLQLLLDTIADVLNDFAENGASYVHGIVQQQEPTTTD